MGGIWKPNMVLSIPLLLYLIASTEEISEEISDKEETHIWIVFVTYAVVSYIISLRGNEDFLLDLEDLNENWKRNDKSYFIIALLRKIKGENVDLRHLILCVNHTNYGITIKAVVRHRLSLFVRINGHINEKST